MDIGQIKWDNNRTHWTNEKMTTERAIYIAIFLFKYKLQIVVTGLKVVWMANTHIYAGHTWICKWWTSIYIQLHDPICRHRARFGRLMLTATQIQYSTTIRTVHCSWTFFHWIFIIKVSLENTKQNRSPLYVCVCTQCTVQCLVMSTMLLLNVV